MKSETTATGVVEDYFLDVYANALGIAVITPQLFVCEAIKLARSKNGKPAPKGNALKRKYHLCWMAFFIVIKSYFLELSKTN